jgi:hypothetical protein
LKILSILVFILSINTSAATYIQGELIVSEPFSIDIPTKKKSKIVKFQKGKYSFSAYVNNKGLLIIKSDAIIKGKFKINVPTRSFVNTPGTFHLTAQELEQFFEIAGELTRDEGLPNKEFGTESCGTLYLYTMAAVG